MIYAYVFEDIETCGPLDANVKTQSDKATKNGGGKKALSQRSPSVAILRASKLVYSEACEILYSGRRYEIRMTADHITMLGQRLDHRGRKSNRLQKMKMQNLAFAISKIRQLEVNIHFQDFEVHGRHIEDYEAGIQLLSQQIASFSGLNLMSVEWSLYTKLHVFGWSWGQQRVPGFNCQMQPQLRGSYLRTLSEAIFIWPMEYTCRSVRPNLKP